MPRSISFSRATESAIASSSALLAEATGGAAHPEMISLLEGLANFYFYRERYDEAAPVLARIVEVVRSASPHDPQLIVLHYDPPQRARADVVLGLVGKAITFDSGGISLKPRLRMQDMKGDMAGGAAVIQGLAAIAELGLPVRAIGVVASTENVQDAAAYKPGDILRASNGKTIEVINTDAEGRLVLADALALADEEAPELIVDMATLTGAARVALGPELPPFYTGDDALAADFARHAKAENDPMWRMPLWKPYESLLDSKTADINNVGGSFAGSITAALFLNRFVATRAWAHFDVYGWTPSEKPARPYGGECQAARALYALLKQRYS